MNEEIAKLFSGDEIGIKDVKVVQRIAPKTFSECGVFSYREIKKGFKAGRGIVERVIENVVYFECMHKATPEAFGGLCWRGTAVCKDCIIKCAEPSCTRYVCRVENCDCGGVRDGNVYCTIHFGIGLIGLLSLAFRKHEPRRIDWEQETTF